jgi:DNA-binding HxlR family transcriptional regulator
MGNPAHASQPSPAAGPSESADADEPAYSGCCPHYHQAVELIGRRWTGAIIAVLIAEGPHRFSELRDGVPGLSDRVLSQRMRELEAAGIVVRDVDPGPPVRVRYDLTSKGEDLRDVVRALERWGRTWADPAPADVSPGTAACNIERSRSGTDGIALG